MVPGVLQEALTVTPHLPSCTLLPDLRVWEGSSQALSSSCSTVRGWEGSGRVPIFPGGYTSYPCSNTPTAAGAETLQTLGSAQP